MFRERGHRGRIGGVWSALVPLHMGAMHPFEQVLTLLLAFGPFLVLGLVVVLRRRADAREDAEAVARAVKTPGEGAGTTGAPGDQRAR